MYICVCRVVSRSTVEGAIAQGARTVEEIGERCAAGTDCGKCQRLIERLLTLAEQPPPAHPRQSSEPNRGA